MFCQQIYSDFTKKFRLSCKIMNSVPIFSDTGNKKTDSSKSPFFKILFSLARLELGLGLVVSEPEVPNYTGIYAQ